MLGVLEVLDTGQQHAGVGDDGPARLEHQGQVAAVQALADGADVVAGQRRLFVAVAHPEATTEVQVANADAFAGQAVDQPEQALEGVEEGSSWVNCEPMWQSTPITSRWSSSAARA